jgi:dihydrofolate synthase / folylpolyglutamate synthase
MRLLPEPPSTDLPELTYDDLVAELFPRLTGGIRWGLERTRLILAEAGDPHLALRVLHVGGTNGKGSVAANLDAILQQAGLRTGLYTSPHLCTLRERIRVDGRAIEPDALVAAARRLWPVIRRTEASFFEATTAIAFLALREAGIDVAVVEVGLGGRLDATNVVVPALTVLTNVSLDHVQLLGSALHDVAREKAGIIKARVPVVTAETTPDVLEVFAAAAAAVDAPLHRLRPDEADDLAADMRGTEFVLPTQNWGSLRLHTPLPGRHQVTNAALAVRALDVLRPDGVDAAAVAAGVAAVRWPGRFQVERVAGVTFVFDVAHNAAGIDALVAALAYAGVPLPLTVVAGVLGDKDWRSMLIPLQRAAAAVILTQPPTAPPDRRWDPVEALAAAPADNTRITADFTAALEQAYAAAADRGGAVVVTGSFHTVGDALCALGLAVDGSDFALPAPSFAR